MTKLLLSLHVLAVILAIGPITVAASMFPRYAKPPLPGAGGPHDHDLRTAALLHRICRGYTLVGIAVPVFGLATAWSLGVLTDAWLLTSISLTAGAAALLVLLILPGQQQLINDQKALATTTLTTDTIAAYRSAAAGLAMTTGIFNLLWAIVVVLMIIRPGSTTGT